MVGDWISATHPTLGTFSVRIQQWEYNGSTQIIQAGKRVFSASKVFADYLRPAVEQDAEPLSKAALTDGAGTFDILHGNYNAGGLTVYYEENYTQSEEGITVVVAEIGTFMSLLVNGKVVPPGRLKLLDGGSVKIDITDYCLVSTTLDKTNTISRTLHRATGWSGADSTVSQYRARAFLAP